MALAVLIVGSSLAEGLEIRDSLGAETPMAYLCRLYADQ
jgi:hypothetical protein